MSDEDLKYICEKLHRIIYLYPNYSVDSRGPYGLLLDVIKMLDSKVHTDIVELGPDRAYELHFGNEDGQ